MTIMSRKILKKDKSEKVKSEQDHFEKESILKGGTLKKDIRKGNT